MVAIDAVYHLRCLNRLYKKADAIRDGSNKIDDNKLQHQQAFVELQEYIESFRGSSDVISMTDVRQMYERRLTELGILTTTHTTRLRKSLVEAIPDLECIQNKNGKWDLLFNESLADAVVELKRRDTAKDKVAVLSQAAHILREAILEARNHCYPLTDKITDVPDEMKVFLNLVMNGSQVNKNKDYGEKATEKVVGAIGQVIAFNTVSKNKGVTRRS